MNSINLKCKIGEVFIPEDKILGIYYIYPRKLLINSIEYKALFQIIIGDVVSYIRFMPLDGIGTFYQMNEDWPKYDIIPTSEASDILTRSKDVIYNFTDESIKDYLKRNFMKEI